MIVDTIRFNGYETPLGVQLGQVRCSWKVRDAVGTKAENVRVTVAADKEMTKVLLIREGQDLDSAGEPLDYDWRPRTRYYVQVSVRSNAGETAVSAPVWFETGKMEESWAASWIGNGDNVKAPEFRKTFPSERPVGEIDHARLYITGLGLFEAVLNGTKVGEDVLAPFSNDYNDHVQVCTYDVTELLSEGNDLRVFLGNGWYKGHFGLSCQDHPEYPYALLAELIITYRDGTEQVLGTEPSWEVRPSVFSKTDIYGGETQDWLSMDRSDAAWSNAVTIDAPSAPVDRYSLPLTVMETLPVAEVIHTPKGETVLDFGQNFAGFVRISQTVPKGTTLKLEFGELLQEGCFFHDNYRTAESVFEYISDGVERTVEAHFTFFGFRYVKVTGLPEIDPQLFTGCVVYSKMDRTGFLETGHEKVNRLYLNTLWGMKSNFLDMPTDCPQRDERVGWCGDAMVFSNTAGFHMNTQAFYAKFLRDLRLDQQKNGGRVAIYLPNEFRGIYAAVWSDIGTFLPKMVYDYYGSKDLLKEHYPLMKDWVDFVDREDEAQHKEKTYLYDFGFQFGDWLALDGATEQSRYGRTDNGYVASIYYYASTRYVAEAAEVLGLPEAEEYAERAERIRAAVLKEYFTASGRLAVDTQTGYLLALKFGVYVDKERILRGLKARLQQDCYRIKGGFVGATMMNTVLAENGMADTAYDFLLFDGFPGWLYEVDHGATTIWERWNSVLPDGKVSGVSMNSMNHYAYGSVMEFLYRFGMGLQPTSPGFRAARIAPVPDIRLGHLNGSFDSAYGTYVSNWTIQEDGTISFHIEIPFGCSAELCLPEQEPVHLDAGTYDYTITTKRNYRSLYSGTSRFEDLLKDERALAVLNECLPGFVDTIDRTDKEEMTRSLERELLKANLFRMPTDNIEKAIDGISAIVA